jgi:twitching motility protein PilT
MALFGQSNKNLVQKLAVHAWRSDEEREEMIEKFQSSGARPADVISLLWNKDHGVRGAAATIFTNKADAKVVGTLLDSLQGEPPQHRSYAIRLLGRMDDKIVEPAIEGCLSAPQTGRRRMGWEAAFAMKGPLQRKYLERGIKDAPPAMRLTALNSLLKDTPPKALRDTLMTLVRAEDDRVRAKAIEALIEVRDPEVFGVMVERFQEDTGVIRESAGKYLQEYAAEDPKAVRQRVLHMLSQGDDATRHLSIDILMRTGAAKEVLLEVLAFSRGLAPWLKQRILETLRTKGDDFLRPAVELLNHQDEDIRNAALVLAEEFNDPRVVGPVCRLLEGEDWWQKIAACDTLGKIKDDRAVPHLIRVLEDADTRWAALDALAQIGSPSALKPIINLMRDKRPEVRLEVIRAVGQFNDKRILGLLKQVAEKDPVMEVRTRATEVARDLAGRLHIDIAGKIVARTSTKLDKPIDKLLTKIREDDASDIHLAPDEPPFVRQFGVLERMDMKPLSGEAIEKIIGSMLTERQRKNLEENGELDFCYAIDEVGRYRANAYRTRVGMGVSFRVIPNVAPTFSDLGLPNNLTELLDYHQGVILVTGPAGSGKSTTLAALVNLINEAKAEHVLLLEDPVEFVHPPKLSLVNQREIGVHSESFARALRGALREDPDIIIVGELRDPETTRMSLEAAETGHLVITTMPTNSAVSTIERLVGSFPPEEQGQVRMSLSESLKFVISQSLLPRADGQGRVAVFEILKGTFAVGSLIRDGKTIGIPSLMQIGRRQGMQTVDMALEDLVDAGMITAESAYMRAEKPEIFAPRCAPSFLESLSF